MCTGGHAQGTAQLAATASTSSTPEPLSNTTNSPVAMSIAVTRRIRSGQSCDGRRCSITARRTGPGTVSVASAIAPIRCSFWAEVVSGVSIAVMNSPVMSSMSTPESIS